MSAFLVDRTIHVVATAVILGGSLTLAIAASTCTGQIWLGEAARRYEWVFWVAASLIVVTGVGNVAARGQDLPTPDRGWGFAFQLKLLTVGLLLAISFGRTLLVTLDARPALLTRAYGATAAVGTLVLIAAAGLAHG